MRTGTRRLRPSKLIRCGDCGKPSLFRAVEYGRGWSVPSLQTGQLEAFFQVRLLTGEHCCLSSLIEVLVSGRFAVVDTIPLLAITYCWTSDSLSHTPCVGFKQCDFHTSHIAENDLLPGRYRR